MLIDAAPPPGQDFRLSTGSDDGFAQCRHSKRSFLKWLQEIPIIEDNVLPLAAVRQGESNLEEADDSEADERSGQSLRPGALPPRIAKWVGGLASERKRNYTELYALARLTGGVAPEVPSFARKDWPKRARQRIDRLLDVGSQDHGAAGEDTQAPACDASLPSDDGIDISWSSVLPPDVVDIAWDTVPIRELIPELVQVDEQLIPYARFPRSVAVLFSPRLKTWSDVSHLTPSSLMNAYGATEQMVRTFAAIARDVALQSELSAVNDSPPDAIVVSAIEQLSGLDASFSLVSRWWSVTAHEVPFSLRNILELDTEGLPADVADAVIQIAAFAFMSTPTLVTPTDAVQDILEEFDDRERVVMSSRLWRDKPETLEAVAARVGLTRERVRQIQNKVAPHLARILLAAAHRPVAWYAHEVRTILGPCLPQTVAVEHLERLQIPVPSETANVLLYLAGPYRIGRNGWLEIKEAGGEDRVASAIEDLFGSTTIASSESLINALAATGMPSDIAVAYLQQQSGLRQWGDSWIAWGGTAVDKAYKVLGLIGEPSTAELINDAISEGHSVNTVKNGISQDPRFLRTGKRTWGLRTWGLEEYSGIAEEILERIDARGGAVDIEDLVHELVHTFPDISEASVRMYLGTPAVMVEGDLVRRRKDSDGWVISQTVRDARGMFRIGDDELRLLIPVTRDVLRGSGQSVNPAVSAAVGVTPGHDRTFTSSADFRLTVKWRPWSTSGPDIGSLRGLPAVADAGLGDAIVLILRLDDGSVDAVRIPALADDQSKLATILGARPDENLALLVAASIDCRASEVRSALRKRGDGDLADYIPAITDTRLTSEIEDLIAQLS